MAEKKLDIIINAKDKSKTAFKSAEKSMSGLSGMAKKLSVAVAGLYAFKKVTNFVKESTKAFGEQERAEKKLESIMTKVNHASKEQIAQMKKQAGELQKVTTVGDEVTLALQAQLGTFTLSSDSIMTLTEQTLNLAVANKGVNVTQEDMINYGNLVGKVMTGQAGALTKYGVTLTDAQKKAIQLGNEQERAATIAEVLKSNYGSLARDMRDTYEGQLQSFTNAWGDMKELLGEKLMPVLMKLLSWATETGIPFIIEYAGKLKSAWDSNFLGIKTIVVTTTKVIVGTLKTIIAIIEKLVAGWEKAMKAYDRFKKKYADIGTGTNALAPALIGGGAMDTSGERINLAKGGFAYAQRGKLFSSRGTDTIPAMLTPGELVLNRSQQENLARQLTTNNININISNPNFADRLSADSIIEKIKRVIQQANLGVA